VGAYKGEPTGDRPPLLKKLEPGAARVAASERLGEPAGQPAGDSPS